MRANQSPLIVVDDAPAKIKVGNEEFDGQDVSVQSSEVAVGIKHDFHATISGHGIKHSRTGRLDRQLKPAQNCAGKFASPRVKGDPDVNHNNRPVQQIWPTDMENFDCLSPTGWPVNHCIDRQNFIARKTFVAKIVGSVIFQACQQAPKKNYENLPSVSSPRIINGRWAAPRRRRQVGHRQTRREQAASCFRKKGDHLRQRHSAHL